MYLTMDQIIADWNCEMRFFYIKINAMHIENLTSTKPLKLARSPYQQFRIKENNK